MINLKLFPFDKVAYNSSIIIYGAGELGLSFSNQIKNLNYCNLLCFLDSRANSKKIDDYTIIFPNQISTIKYEYDYVVIASIAFKNEMYSNLTNLGVDKKKIICIDENYLLLDDRNKMTPANVDWDAYYNAVEKDAPSQFLHYFKPKLDRYNLAKPNSIVLDFACGRGRIANYFKDICQKVICCDSSTDALEFCQNRFKENTNVIYSISKSNGIQLENESIDFIYSWDAMVHFSYKSLDFYMSEFYRLLKNSGYAFIHHSNLINSEPFNNDIKDGIWDGKNKSEIWYENIGYRSNISKEEFAFIAKKHGFEIINQETIDWSAKNLDCISIIKK